MRLFSGILLFLGIFSLILSCSSTTAHFSYPESLRNSKITVSLYFEAEGEPSYECSSSLTKISPCYSRHDEIYSGLAGINAAEKLKVSFDSFKPGLDELMQFGEVINGEIPHAYNELHNTSYGIIPLQLDSISSKIRTDYILELNIQKFGFISFKGRPFLYVKFYAALHDVKTGSIEWKDVVEQNFPYGKGVRLKNVSAADTSDAFSSAMDIIASGMVNSINSFKNDENKN